MSHRHWRKKEAREKFEFPTPFRTISTRVLSLVGFVSSRITSRYISQDPILSGLKVVIFVYLELGFNFLIRPLDFVFDVIFGMYSENSKV